MIEGAAALLRWYVEQGVDEAIGEEPIDRFAAPPPPVAAAAVTPIAPAADARIDRWEDAVPWILARLRHGA